MASEGRAVISLTLAIELGLLVLTAASLRVTARGWFV